MTEGTVARAPRGGAEVSGLRRRFGADAPALDGVDLVVRPGEFAALLGPSGSGKTTLLRILAGLDFPDAGAVRIGGQDVARLPARERGVGFVPQNYALFRHMSVFENVAFGLRVRPRATRPAGAEIAARVRRLLELVQIPELERRFPEQISGGQRQRVALARALAIEPELLLLDEPFSALDAQVRKGLRVWLRGLHESLGITSVLVTHDQEEAMEIADRVAVLRGGRLAQFDTPAALLAGPADSFVAGFLGEANRLDCRVRDGMAHFDPLPLAPVPAALPDGPALAFVRPADLLAAPGAGGWTVRAARPDARGARLLVAAGDGVPLDAVPDTAWRDAARGDGCAVRVLSAAVFPRGERNGAPENGIPGGKPESLPARSPARPREEVVRGSRRRVGHSGPRRVPGMGSRCDPGRAVDRPGRRIPDGATCRFDPVGDPGVVRPAPAAMLVVTPVRVWCVVSRRAALHRRSPTHACLPDLTVTAILSVGRIRVAGSARDAAAKTARHAPPSAGARGH